MFVISIDSDWAIEPLIKDTVEILKEYGIKATFFLTNKIDFNILNGHELAIHPKFTTFSNQEKILSKTLDILPTKRCKGSRSHRMYCNSPLIASYEKFGIEYDSNFDIPESSMCNPFFFKGVDVLEIPVYLTDDGQFSTMSSFDLEGVNLDDSGVKVFLFHPFHIYMNTASNADYQKNKPYYKNFKYLQKNRNTAKKGTRNLFLNLLDYIENNDIKTKTMEQVNNIWRQKRLDHSKI